ncbi:MAG: hypothetical protein HDR26_00220 [Lachnospiraceae bacterium]|nr:hypothetical protein [Lachnospiraceae bacterium]
MRFEEFIYYERKAAAEEAAKEAAKETIMNDILDLLEDYGEIPSGLKEKLETVNDADLLRKYHKLAARAGSLEAFMEKME